MPGYLIKRRLFDLQKSQVELRLAINAMKLPYKDRVLTVSGSEMSNLVNDRENEPKYEALHKAANVILTEWEGQNAERKRSVLTDKQNFRRTV